MGGLALMLIITILICGGVPILAFAYMNGKIGRKTNTPNKEQSNRKVILLTILILGTFFNCFLFPVYNFTECSTHGMRWQSVFIITMATLELGVLFAGAFPYTKETITKTIFTILGFNSIHILAGLGCRYLLEFGETSNTYIFTLTNVIVHVLVINVLCLVCWLFVITEKITIKKD